MHVNLAVRLNLPVLSCLLIAYTYIIYSVPKIHSSKKIYLPPFLHIFSITYWVRNLISFRNGFHPCIVNLFSVAQTFLTSVFSYMDEIRE